MDMDMWKRPLRRGEIVDDCYELTEPLAKGGMAEVWRARRLSDGHRVAVKFLRPDTEDLQQLDTADALAELDALRGRFRREGTLLGKLSHPGIPELYGQGNLQGRPYLAMRLVEGQTLKEFLAEGSTPFSVAAAVAAQVADALECAHQRPLIHRDLKPENIMISENGRVVIIDFGIAKPLGGNATQYTRRGSTLGSRGYQAPEQIQERKPSDRTDVYSVGCICYELFTGRPPFVADDHDGLPGKHLFAKPAPLSRYAAGIPDALDDVVFRMLAKEPQERPHIGEFLTVVSPLTPSPGDPAPEPRPRYDPTLPYRKATDAEPAHLPRRQDDGDEDAAAQAMWLDVPTVEQVCTEAECELNGGDPGESVSRLADIAPRAREEWGIGRPLVRRVWFLAADGLRLAGDCGRAAELFEGLAGGLLFPRNFDDQALRLTAQLRAAECRLPFGEMSEASAVVREVSKDATELPGHLAQRIEEVRREVALDLDERQTGIERA